MGGFATIRPNGLLLFFFLPRKSWIVDPNSLVIPCGSIWPSAWSKPQMWVSNYLSYVSLELSIYTVFITFIFLLLVCSGAQKAKFILHWNLNMMYFFWCCCYFNFSITQNYLLCDAIMSLAVFTGNHQFQDSQNVRKTSFQSCTKRNSSVWT